jgi:hypothetical protein
VRSAIPQGGGVVAGERVALPTPVSLFGASVAFKKNGEKREDVVDAKQTNACEAQWNGPFINGEFF